MERVQEPEDRRRQERQKMQLIIEDAKWHMYAEQWEAAKGFLEEARDIAVFLRDKASIDTILELLSKCKDHEKVEL